MPRRLVLVAVAFAVALTSWSAKAQEPSKVDRVFDRIEANKGVTLWDDVRELRDIGKEGLDAFRQGLTRADANVRIAAGAALFGAEAREEGVEALLQTAKDSKQEGARPRAAHTAALVTESGKAGLTDDQKAKFHDRFLEAAAASDDDLVKVHLLRGAYPLKGNIAIPRLLRDIFDKTPRPAVKDEAALALASIDRFEAVRSHLRSLGRQPGENGRLARTWLKYDETRERTDEAGSGSGSTYAVLDEIIEKLEKQYWDPKQVDRKKLIEAAAKGMMGSLDPYTMYYDGKMLDQFRKEEMEGHYGGIGARVTMRRDVSGALWLTITEPIFSGPAYRAGLRSNDTITTVDGEDTRNRDQDELVTKLRGKPGTPVKIKVARRGWKEPKEFVITREEVQLETTMSEMLPGGIGYVHYTTFGSLERELENKKTNIETQIKALADQGMKALVLDIRFNPGGYLSTAGQIAGMFLQDGDIILTTKARGKTVKTYRAEKPPSGVQVRVPTILLVNELSASASEILAGALQHYKKATLVGERTFGKGSVQEVREVEVDELLVLGEDGTPLLGPGGRKQYSGAARITIAKWYLPSGKTVEKERYTEADGASEPGGVKKDTGGVEPDIKVALPDLDYWKAAEFEKLRAAGKIEDYVAKEFSANKEIFEALAVTDAGDYRKYPKYDEMYATLGTRATKEEVRELVREFVRKRVQDERKRAFYLDLQLDVQLQRAILEALKATKQEAKGIKEYEHFAVAK